jgi:hypothetical protein
MHSYRAVCGVLTSAGVTFWNDASTPQRLAQGQTPPYPLDKRKIVGARNSGADLYLPICPMPQWRQWCIACNNTLPFLNELGAFDAIPWMMPMLQESL